MTQLDGFKEFSFSNLISWQIEKKTTAFQSYYSVDAKRALHSLGERTELSQSGVHLIDFEVKIDTFHRLEWINFNF